MIKKSISFLILFVVFISIAGTAFSENKTALVIGNAAYTHVTPLNNPVNDARDIARELKALGFTVIVRTDATLPQMEEGVVELQNSLKRDPDSTGLFFYAGHGVQADGVNYLIPANADIQSGSQLRYRATSVDFVLDSMNEAGNSLNLIVLDACRDNPFPWKRGGNRGLAVVGRQPPGSIIMYATGAGDVASDGTGRNGLFTEKFLQSLKEPGMDVMEMFRLTGQSVQQASSGKQNPAIYSQYFGRYALNGSLSGSDTSSFNGSTGSGGEDSRPSFSVEKAYGSASFSAVTAGTLYMNGTRQGDIPAGGSGRLDNLETESYSFEMRYPDGEKETKRVTVEKDRTTSVAFTHTEREVGSAKISVQTAGSLYIAGLYKRYISGGSTVTLSDLDAGSSDFEMRYSNGETETNYVMVEKNRTANITFNWKPVVVVPEGFVLVEAGSFTMGSPTNELHREDDETQHTVRITKNFFMSKYEVTQSEWESVMGYTVTELTDSRDSSERQLHGTGRNFPMYYVNWYDAVEYCNRRSRREGLSPCYSGSGKSIRCNFSANGYRLPTEAEWEYAARGGQFSKGYKYAGSDNRDSVAWHFYNSNRQSNPVGQLQANELGLYDMSGSVSEWCNDWYRSYSSGSVTDPTGPSSGSRRVYRGGNLYTDYSLRSASRENMPPDWTRNHLGFRLVRCP